MRERQRTILIVEDNAVESEYLELILSEQGHNVVGRADNGKRALELTLELEPDAIVMDIEMPVVDGLTAAHQIQELLPTPVVILTAHDDVELAEEASQVGVGAYVTKPASPDALARALAIAVARHQDLIKLRALVAELEEQKAGLEKALADNKALRGIIPICSYCKRIRDDAGYWQKVEAYLADQSDVSFTHGMCPECFAGVKKRHGV